MSEMLDDFDAYASPSVADAEAAFRDVAADLAGYRSAGARKDIQNRPILVTPYDGAYGFAGVVVTINGSPPRGTFLVPGDALEAYGDSIILHVYDGRVSRLTSYCRAKAWHVVRAYLRALAYDRRGRTA